MSKNIQILDCTLRDGGLGLEDAEKNDLSHVRFSENDSRMTAGYLADSAIDIIELGSIEITSDDRTGFCIYQNIEDVSKQMPLKKKQNQMFAALYRGPDTPIEDIPEWNSSLCEAVRVIIRYSELQKSLDFCAALSTKGYKVFVQPMLTMRYTKEEIKLLIEKSNEMNAYALYFVDSYGYMENKDVVDLYNVDMNSARDIIIDSCVMGMGQGAGNLQTELIIGYLNKVDNKYNFSEVLNACEIIEKYYTDALWGYSVTRLLPALHRTAYKYSIALRNKYKKSYAEINEILSHMPEDLRQRYTTDNVEKLIKIAEF